MTAILHPAGSGLVHPSGVSIPARELYGSVEMAAHHEIPFDTWRLRHLQYLIDRADRGLARISSGHPYFSIDILRYGQPQA